MSGVTDSLPYPSSYGDVLAGDMGPSRQNGASVSGAGRHRASGGSRREPGQAAASGTGAYTVELPGAGLPSMMRESDDFLVTRGDLDTHLSLELSRGRGGVGAAAGLLQQQAAGGAPYNTLPLTSSAASGAGAGLSSASATLAFAQSAAFQQLTPGHQIGPNALALYDVHSLSTTSNLALIIRVCMFCRAEIERLQEDKKRLRDTLRTFEVTFSIKYVAHLIFSHYILLSFYNSVSI